MAPAQHMYYAGFANDALYRHTDTLLLILIILLLILLLTMTLTVYVSIVSCMHDCWQNETTDITNNIHQNIQSAMYNKTHLFRVLLYQQLCSLNIVLLGCHVNCRQAHFVARIVFHQNGHNMVVTLLNSDWQRRKTILTAHNISHHVLSLNFLCWATSISDIKHVNINMQHSYQQCRVNTNQHIKTN